MKIFGAILIFFGILFMLGGWFNKSRMFALELLLAPILLYFGLELLK
ncbi:MAG: hypothetical protein QMD12_02220 [Candidatus Aenigmarchaeota archaeon]|nr:hypothetical protein [Candidatus Aenigmarchaeota archaeon]